jgi:prepilin peptidase CpaA
MAAIALFSPPLDHQVIISHIAAALLVLLVGFILFARSLFGGGDVKLMAAMALWTGFVALPRFVLITTLAGGILALAFLILRYARRSTGEGLDRRLPYGIAIAAGGLDFCIGHTNSLTWLSGLFTH